MQLNNRKYILALLLLIATINGFSQGTDFLNAVHWKLYDVHGQKMLAYGADSLIHFGHMDLNDDTMRSFLQASYQWPKDKSASWMGYFAVSCEKAGAIHKIDVSVYGGFLYDETDHLYYGVPEDARAAWHEYLNRNFDQLIKP